MNYYIIGEKCSTIRTLARDALAGHWKIGFLAMLIVHVILVTSPEILYHLIGVGGIFTSVVIMIIVAGPMQLGIAIFSLAVARGQKPQVAHVFYGFGNFGKAVGLFWWVALKIFLWSLIAVPFSLMAIPLIARGNYFLGLLFFIPGVIPAIIAAYRYIQVYYILADNPEIGVFECVEQSKIIMTGNKLKHFILTLTFIGWAMLAGLPIGFITTAMIGQTTLFSIVMVTIVSWLAMFFVEAYVWTSLAVFYDMIVGNLRPGTIQTTGELVGNQPVSYSEQHQSGYKIQHQQADYDNQHQQADYGNQQTSYTGQQESTKMPPETPIVGHEQTPQVIIPERGQTTQQTSQSVKIEEIQAFPSTANLDDNVPQKEQDK